MGRLLVVVLGLGLVVATAVVVALSAMFVVQAARTMVKTTTAAVVFGIEILGMSGVNARP